MLPSVPSRALPVFEGGVVDDWSFGQ